MINYNENDMLAVRAIGYKEGQMDILKCVVLIVVLVLIVIMIF